jgi:hypothetical protein
MIYDNFAKFVLPDCTGMFELYTSKDTYVDTEISEHFLPRNRKRHLSIVRHFLQNQNNVFFNVFEISIKFVIFW